MTQDDELGLITKALRRLDPSFKKRAAESSHGLRRKKVARRRATERVFQWKELHPEQVKKHLKNWRKNHRPWYNAYMAALMRKRRALQAAC